MRRVSNAQVRKLMEEMNKHGEIGLAAMKADMDRTTARKYVKAAKLPSEMTTERSWRTRPDAFEGVWREVEELLKAEEGLDAKTVFEVLQVNHPGKFVDGQLRTLQRQVRRFRAAHGAERNVVLAQRHRPGEAMQTDFTVTTELQVTVCGEPMTQCLLCNSTLPYSNWRWATVCSSESMPALRQGLQRALFQLGRVPEWHQTDNSTAATHKLGRTTSTTPGGSAGPGVCGAEPRDVSVRNRPPTTGPSRSARLSREISPSWVVPSLRSTLQGVCAARSHPRQSEDRSCDRRVER